MELYTSIQRLIETTSFSPDTVLWIFAKAYFVYYVLEGLVIGVSAWLIWHGLNWLKRRFSRRNNKP